MSVVLYHFGLRCPGGYVGVDAFFVMSVFLITRVLSTSAPYRAASSGSSVSSSRDSLVDGAPHVLDVNRTPSRWTSDPVPADAEWARETARALAPGIQSRLVDPPCSRAATARSRTSEERA